MMLLGRQHGPQSAPVTPAYGFLTTDIRMGELGRLLGHRVFQHHGANLPPEAVIARSRRTLARLAPDLPESRVDTILALTVTFYQQTYQQPAARSEAA